VLYADLPAADLALTLSGTMNEMLPLKMAHLSVLPGKKPVREEWPDKLLPPEMNEAEKPFCPDEPSLSREHSAQLPARQLHISR